ANRLRTILRPTDIAARLGGDEFTILLENISGPSDASRVAERIGEELSRPFAIRSRDVFTSASVGIAVSMSRYSTADDIVRDADIAMYRAKEGGKGRYEIFDLQMHAAAVDRMQIEMDLRHAIERNEFRIEYQPIVSLRSGELHGFEALLRWDHPSRGVVMPGDFIPIAEETNLIVPLGRWVMREVCDELKRWKRRTSAPLKMSINLSPRQMLDPTLLDSIDNAIGSFDVDQGAVQLEITETAVADERAADVLSRVRQLGVGLSIDDFGT